MHSLSLPNMCKYWGIRKMFLSRRGGGGGGQGLIQDFLLGGGTYL